MPCNALRCRASRDIRSGRPDSNRRRPAWEAGILPTELRPQIAGNMRLADVSNITLRRDERKPFLRTPSFPPTKKPPMRSEACSERHREKRPEPLVGFEPTTARLRIE